MALESFAFIGVKNLVFKNKKTHEAECLLKHLVSLTLNDETAEDFLRGGYGNPKLLTIYGDRDTTLEGSTATMTADLLKIMSSNEVKSKTKPVQVVEEIEVTTGDFTLGQTVSTSITSVTVYALDSTGLSTKLTAVTQDSDVTDATKVYVSGQTGKVDSTVEKVRAIYMTDKEVQTIEGTDFVAKTYEANGTLVAKNIEDGTLYIADLELPNCTVSPSFSLSSKNESAAPDAVSLTISLVNDSVKGYSYAINFYEDVTA